MTEGLVCFNCGKPTDLVTDAYGAICRDCYNARKPAVTAEEGASDYGELTVEELRDILRDRDLPVGGTKAELIDRLQADDAEEE
jgi:hypothetical protein